MIGYVFEEAKAVVLACAPSAKTSDEYVILVRTNKEYVIAFVPVRDLPDPKTWSTTHASFLSHNPAGAASEFAKLTGIADVQHLVGCVTNAESTHNLTITMINPPNLGKKAR